ncbi:MAG: hypothetical protein RIS52_2125 [Pseudomonadota bacterium]
MAPIIRTCSSLVAVAVALAPPAAFAKRSAPQRSALGYYVGARVSDAAGDESGTLAGYSAALATEPGNQLLALRTARAALRQGNFALALRAGHQLDVKNGIAGDALMLLIAERVKLGDWRGAGALVGALENDAGFNFMEPLFRAWIAFGARSGDPLAILDAIPADSYASNYAGESRAYFLLARGQQDEAIALATQEVARFGGLSSLRLTAAAALQRSGKRDEALAMLDGNRAELGDAYALVAGGRALPQTNLSAQQGMAQLFSRLSFDLLAEKIPTLALMMARTGRYLDPANPVLGMVEARALYEGGKFQAAEGALARLSRDPIVGREAAQQRVACLDALGQSQEALALAQSLVLASPKSSLVRSNLGELLEKRGQFADAAVAYGAAIQNAEAGDNAIPLWRLWFDKARALERGGDWPGAKVALQKAIILAPDQAGPLHQLGNGMVKRRENLPEALRLIRTASRIAPDDVSILDALGWALFLNGDDDEAITVLESAARVAPGDTTINEHLGDAYWRVGRKVDARYAWSAAAIHAQDDAATRLAAKLDIGWTAQSAAR